MTRGTEAEKRWAVVLAGGDGTPLRRFTRRIAGDDRPKQFCRLLGNRTMLDQARARPALLVPPERTLFVVAKTHERFYRPLLTDVRADNPVIQHDNRGTAPAILYALLRIAVQEPEARIVVLPSDHYVSDDVGFMNHVDGAFLTLARWRELTILLGMTPDRAEDQYGWIEPGETLSDSPPLYRVRRFWEKPAPRVALAVWARGALWNSFVMVARATSLLALIERAASALYRAFIDRTDALGRAAETEVFRRRYNGVTPMDFSGDVLAAHRGDLAVLPVSGIEWSDVGDPARVYARAVAQAQGHRVRAFV
jgi:mannose-1-phosphate guanylyltransferase